MKVQSNIKFEKRNKKKIKLMSKDKVFLDLSKKWFLQGYNYEYSYHFKWLGRPIIQYPQDIIALQEIIWKIKPDLIIETGIAHGGSIIFYASILEMIGKGRVIGIDIDIKRHNKKEIEKHFLYKRIQMIDGSSINKKVVKKVQEFTKNKQRVMVFLDSNHTYKHVLKELELYSPMVTRGSYLVVFDTIIDDLPNSLFTSRPWGQGNNPKEAVHEYLNNNSKFKIDKAIENKLAITAGPDGYVRRIK